MHFMHRQQHRCLLVTWMMLAATTFFPAQVRVAAQQPLSCACALAPSNHVINCNANDANQQAILNKAMTDLQTNNCDQGSSCRSNDVCQTAFYLLQAHHDYCFSNEVPTTLSSLVHTFEEFCTDCHVIRKYNPSLPACPQANCDNKSGLIAYEFIMSESSCQEKNCDRQDCAEAFRILRAVYETCPDGTLHLIAELAINDWDDRCAAVDCNTGSNNDASQLTCNADGSLLTRPPAPLATTSVPTATPPVPCPAAPDDTDRAVVVGEEGPVCEICGTGYCIADPDEVFRWADRPPIKCQELQDAGLTGFISFDQCNALPELAAALCGCAPAGSYIPYVPPVNLTAPSSAADGDKDDSKDDAIAGSSDDQKAKKNKFGAGVAVGIGAAIGLLALLGTGAVVAYRNRAKSKALRRMDEKEDPSTLHEIEVPELRRPVERQEIA
jgi:hypothetical protein